MGDHLRSFNVSFISRYPSEDERLFIGGYYRIRVQSIKLLKTKQNFESFIAPLYYMDAMLTAASKFPKYTKNAKGVIDHLFKYKLGQNPKPRMDNYLYETFDAFIRNKEHIAINLEYLSQAKESMYKLIMHSIERNNNLKDDSDKTNLIRPVLAEIFSNVKTIHIEALSHSFSLVGFLSVLQESEWKQVTITSFSYGWISKLWQSSKRESIEKEYQSTNYKIEQDRGILTIMKSM